MSIFRCIKLFTRSVSLSSTPSPRYCSTLSSFAHKVKTDDTDEPLSDMKNPYRKEEKLCILCKMNISPDYKNAKLLSQFQSPFTGRIYGRHITGLCQKKQEQVEQEIVKAQNCGYMPYYNKERAFLKDPKLFDPNKPIRPHRF